MSIVLENWENVDNNDIIAIIKREKESKLYYLSIGEIYVEDDCCKFRPYFNRQYLSKKSAVHAIRNYGNFKLSFVYHREGINNEIY